MLRFQLLSEEQDPRRLLESAHQGRLAALPPRAENPWRISNAYWAWKCPRRLVYQALGAPRRAHGFRQELLWSSGAQLEGKLVAALLQAKIPFADYQKSVRWEGERGLLVTGSMDLTIHVNGHKAVIDVKLMGAHKARGLNPRSKSFDIPMTEAAQTNTYAVLDGAAFAGLWGFNRDTLQGHDCLPGDIVLWETNDELTQHVFDGFQVAWDHVQSARDPEELDRGFVPLKSKNLPWECGYCPFASTCWPQAQQYGEDPNKLRV